MDKGKEAGWRIKPPGAYARQQRAVDAGPPEPQWPTTMMAVGILLFIVLFWTIGQLTLITFTELFRWLALFAFAGNLLPQRWYAKRFEMDRMEWFWFNLLAVGPLLLSCCLLLNFFVHGPEQRMLVRAGQGFGLPAYWREHGELPPHLPWPNDFGTDPEKDRLALSTASVDDKVYGIAEGLFGYLVIRSETKVRELLPVERFSVFIPLRNRRASKDAPLFFRRTIPRGCRVTIATEQPLWRSNAEKEQVEWMIFCCEMVLVVRSCGKAFTRVYGLAARGLPCVLAEAPGCSPINSPEQQNRVQPRGQA